MSFPAGFIAALKFLLANLGAEDPEPLVALRELFIRSITLQK